MGTWGPGPFDNDAAADFVLALQASHSRSLAKVLHGIATAADGEYIDADDGGAGWAACEIVALAFGYGDTAAPDDRILTIAGKLRPKEEHRLLALQVLGRISDRTNSELAGLWHEGSDGARFDAAIEDLRSRLQAASKGPRSLPKPKAGDVIALQAEPQGAALIVVQVVSASEMAVFEGTYADDASALNCVRSRPAHRLPASAGELLRRGRAVGHVPLRKDLRGKKMYAGEAGAIERYVLMTASGSGIQSASYQEACKHDEHRRYDADAIRAIALGTRRVARVRSPDEREAALSAKKADGWVARRQITTPGPFGDVALLMRWLQWVEEYGISNAVQRHWDTAHGRQGYGRPNEDSERWSYAFAGVVAIWRGRWSRETWPAALALPPPPDGKLMQQALSAARVLADDVLTREAELRLIWDGAPDHGAALRKQVSSLRKALAE